VTRSNLDPAEAQSEPAIAFERMSGLGEEAMGHGKLTVRGREINPYFLPLVRSLLDTLPLQGSRQGRHDVLFRIENGRAVVRRPSVPRMEAVTIFDLDLCSARSLHPGSDAVDAVLIQASEPGRQIMATQGRYGDEPQDLLSRNSRRFAFDRRIEAL